ncbi:MAG: HIT domain-containing protein [Gammaproteobacteria bacterium]|nr:HIT domain-containing protein [Gammaproteobacteria bacterium]
MFELDKRLDNDTVTIGNLALCRLLLMNDSQYPWLILVPKVAGITEIYQLNDVQRKLLAEESNQIATLLAEEYKADKMNIAALGNVVSQLHIHHIVRYKNDIAWPAPVWGVKAVKSYSEVELLEITARLQRLFSKLDSFVPA